MTHRHRPDPTLLGVLLLALGLGACGGATPPPAAGESRGAVPDLTGTRVMVLPPQRVTLPGDAEAELTFALEGRAPGVDWVMPDELRRAAEGSPGYDVLVEGLPVGVFERAEVRRVGDPLYGYLRRLAALVDARAALIPVSVRYRPADPAESRDEPDPTTAPAPGRVEASAALISVVNGRVLWFGVAGGEPGSRSDPAALASALDALARALGPPAGR
ncbi:MAG: hypothetical protein PVI57_03165 [Gemmatimonadota bacterium]|jgi:hypothetical protein